jgi:hypothetical protein
LNARHRRAFKKNDFGVSSTFGAGNTKIVFIMRIAECALYSKPKRFFESVAKQHFQKISLALVDR